MKPKSNLLLALLLTSLGFMSKAQTTKFNAPIVKDDVIFEEKGGLIATVNYAGDINYEQVENRMKKLLEKQFPRNRPSFYPDKD